MTKKTSFSIKNPIKDEPLLHNHKPQTEIICQQKTKPLNNHKNFLFHQNPIKDEPLLHNHKLQTKIIRQQENKTFKRPKKTSFSIKIPIKDEPLLQPPHLHSEHRG